MGAAARDARAEVAPEHLHGDGAIELEVGGCVHDSHRARAQALTEPVAADQRLADRGIVRRQSLVQGVDLRTPLDGPLDGAHEVRARAAKLADVELESAVAHLERGRDQRRQLRVDGRFDNKLLVMVFVFHSGHRVVHDSSWKPSRKTSWDLAA